MYEPCGRGVAVGITALVLSEAQVKQVRRGNVVDVPSSVRGHVLTCALQGEPGDELHLQTEAGKEAVYYVSPFGLQEVLLVQPKVWLAHLSVSRLTERQREALLRGSS